MSIPAGSTIGISASASNNIKSTIKGGSTIVIHHQPIVGIAFIHKGSNASLFSVSFPFYKLLGIHGINFVTIGCTRLDKTKLILLTRYIIVNFQFSGSCPYKESFTDVMANHYIFRITSGCSVCSCRPRPVILRHVFDLVGVGLLCHCPRSGSSEEQKK